MHSQFKTKQDAFAHMAQCRLGTTASNTSDVFVRELSRLVHRWAADLDEEVDRRAKVAARRADEEQE
jgi:hypothetical protein